MSQNRSIFEDVSAETKADMAPPPPPKKTERNDGDRKGVALWLSVLFGLVALMILVGGWTRLTDSGLSITEWAPITGALPPMSAESWEGEFQKYQQIPEFKLQNAYMTMDEFKVIYWWEWGHRQLGRIVGLVWLAGFAWFYARKSIPPGWTPRLLILGALGGLQGAIGWWMVSSGLDGRMVDVASYRLATHLGLAFIILSALFWSILQLRRSEMAMFQARRQRDVGLGRKLHWLLGLVFAQILVGALVAGIDAGRGYTDWPLMGGELLPSESFVLSPFWSNFFENPALVQFNHRLLGYIVLGYAIYVWLQGRKSALVAVRSWITIGFAVLCIQVVIGIITVMNSAPLMLASLHQLWAIILMCVLLRGLFEVRYPAEQSVRG